MLHSSLDRRSTENKRARSTRIRSVSEGLAASNTLDLPETIGARLVREFNARVSTRNCRRVASRMKTRSRISEWLERAVSSGTRVYLYSSVKRHSFNDYAKTRQRVELRLRKTRVTRVNSAARAPEKLYDTFKCFP